MKEFGLVLVVFVGGGFGSVARYILYRTYHHFWPNSPLPINTLIVNVLGGFLIGLLFALISEKMGYRSSYLWNMVAVGFLGGMTTFSTFSLETINMFADKLYFLALNYILANIALSFLGVILGYILISYAKSS